jgi:hypothetical protein
MVYQRSWINSCGTGISTKFIIDCVGEHFWNLFAYTFELLSAFHPLVNLLPNQQAIFHHKKPKMTKQLTWFRTGTSSGLGEAFALKVLACGDRVIATARNLSKISISSLLVLVFSNWTSQHLEMSSMLKHVKL